MVLTRPVKLLRWFQTRRKRSNKKDKAKTRQDTEENIYEEIPHVGHQPDELSKSDDASLCFVVASSETVDTRNYVDHLTDYNDSEDSDDHLYEIPVIHRDTLWKYSTSRGRRTDINKPRCRESVHSEISVFCYIDFLRQGKGSLYRSPSCDSISESSLSTEDNISKMDFEIKPQPSDPLDSPEQCDTGIDNYVLLSHEQRRIQTRLGNMYGNRLLGELIRSNFDRQMTF